MITHLPTRQCLRRTARYLTGIGGILCLSCLSAAHATQICKSTAPDGGTIFADCEEEATTEQTRISIDASDLNSFPAPTPAPTPATAPTTATAPAAEVAPASRATNPPTVSTPQHSLPTIGSAELDRLLNSALDKDVARLDEIQRDYDDLCEQARERKLAPEREGIVQECLERRFPGSTQRCIDFAANHGAATTQRGPLYYELPQCSDAHALRRLHRDKRNGD